jgi:uncharacterized protein (TIGR03000 family)
MALRKLSVMLLSVLVLTGSFFNPGLAAGQSRITWRIIVGAPPPDPTYRESLDNGQLGPPGYSAGYGYYPYMNLPGIVITNQPAPIAFYTASTPLPESAALFRVRVPRDAEIWFSGAKTSQTGAYRLFVTLPLAEGQAFQYEICARWQQEGMEVEHDRQVSVHAGDRLTIDFLEPAASLGKKARAFPGPREVER